jgi:hypothetical protein
VAIALVDQVLHSQSPAQASSLLGSAAMFLGRIDVGIIEKGNDCELPPQDVDDVGGAGGAADVQQQSRLGMNSFTARQTHDAIHINAPSARSSHHR